MSKQIGVVGAPDFVLGFNLAGVRRSWTVAPTDFPQALDRILAEEADLGILVVQGSDLQSLSPLQKKKVSESLSPVVVAMGEGAGESDLREKVKRAIGIDLWKK